MTVLSNQLGGEKSLYLQQHAANPVAWQRWDEALFVRAAELGRPLFISIGYAACHWCHVMERESFAAVKLAALLNEYFIPVKLDREERPEIDALYIQAAQLMGLHAGWPLSVFAMPDGKPFYIGTYFPPTRRQQLPAFAEVLTTIHSLWTKDFKKVAAQAQQVMSALELSLAPPAAKLNTAAVTFIDTELFGEDKSFVAEYEQYYDSEHGGFKFHGVNKFPPLLALRLFLRIDNREKLPHLRTMVEQTLAAICSGGIYDQLGGGIARYSTDYTWTVPHFEKMLYDNALFIDALVDAYLVTGVEQQLMCCVETADYVLRELRAAQTGAFMSSQAADSDGEEGQYFLWAYEDLAQQLSAEDFAFFKQVYRVTPQGNFRGFNVLQYRATYQQLCTGVLKTAAARLRLKQLKTQLLKLRNRRTPPLTDTKLLVAWNGLMIAALARLGRVLRAQAAANLQQQAKAILRSCEQALNFIWQTLWDEEQAILYRRFAHDDVRYRGLLSDYANLCMALVEVYQSSFKWQWLKRACVLLDVAVQHFSADGGGCYDEDLRVQAFLVRRGIQQDTVEPSGAAKLAEALLACAALSRAMDADVAVRYEARARGIFRVYAEALEAGMMPALQAVLHDYKRGIRSCTFYGTVAARAALWQAAVTSYAPGVYLTLGDNRTAAQAVLCQGTICHPPLRAAKAVRSAFYRALQSFIK